MRSWLSTFLPARRVALGSHRDTSECHSLNLARLLSTQVGGVMMGAILTASHVARLALERWAIPWSEEGS